MGAIQIRYPRFQTALGGQLEPEVVVVSTSEEIVVRLQPFPFETGLKLFNRFYFRLICWLGQTVNG
jgi:hypothetical protein